MARSLGSLFIALAACAVAAVLLVLSFAGSAQDGTATPRTAEEAQAGVERVDTRYPPGDVRRYGAAGDGRTDDTAAFVAAIESGHVVLIPAARSAYRSRQLDIGSGVTIRMAPGAVIEASPGFTENEVLLLIRDRENVRIEARGAEIRMLKPEYSGEYRHGVSIRGSTDVEIVGLASNDSGGDGFYIGRGRTHLLSQNVVLRDVSADNNRRQGLSITSARNVLVSQSRFTNTTGTSPSAGVDIEPNGNENAIENIVLEGLHTEGNRGPGIKIDLRRLPGPEPRSVGIRIVDHEDLGSANGLYISALDVGSHGLAGSIEIVDPVSTNARTSSITVRNYDARGPRVDIRRPVSVRANRAERNEPFLGSAFVIHRPPDERGAAAIGNVHFHDPVVVGDPFAGRLTNLFFIRDERRGGAVRDVSILGTIERRDVSLPVDRLVEFEGAGVVEDASVAGTLSLDVVR